MTVRRVARLLLALLLPLSVVLPSAAHAQTKERAAMKDGLALYDQGEYVDALHKLQEIREGLVLLDAPEQVSVHKYRAYCLIVLSRPAEAKKEFAAALKIDPSFDLDATNTPPKILEVFQELKADLAPPAPHHAAALSAMAPGLGQWRSHRTRAAWVSAGAVAVTLGGLAVTQYWTSQAEDYVHKAGPLERPKIRTQANNYGLLRDGAAVALVGAYALGIVDAWHGANRLAHAPKSGAPVARVHVIPAAAPGEAGLLVVGEF